MEGFGSASRLFHAAPSAETEANFLEMLRGCGEAEVSYRGNSGLTVSGDMTVLMQMAI